LKSNIHSRLTIDKFIEELRNLRDADYGGWVGDSGYISLIKRQRYYTPITAVAELKTGTYWPEEKQRDAARAIGLREKSALNIKEASGGYESRLRKKILRALGLAEVPELF
jgi:hypothetical protein